MTFGEIHKKLRIRKDLDFVRLFAQGRQVAAGKGRYGAGAKKAPHILPVIGAPHKAVFKVNIIQFT